MSRSKRRVILALAAFAGALAAAPALAEAQRAQPCLSATDACVQWVALGKSGARSMVYATQPLTKPDPHIKRALIMVHGTLRNADHYFTTATGAAFLAGALSDTVVIAPAFHSADGECHDRLAAGEVSWSCGAVSWRSGGAAVGEADLTAFDFMDRLLKRLADRRVFPNLKTIVVAGHSAGGQFVTRYEMANTVHDSLGVAVAYVVANPSSYAWPETARPLPQGDAAPDAAASEWKDETARSGYAYGPVAASAPADFDRWPYGLEERQGYAARIGDEALKRQLASRPTTYLLGQVDTLPLGGFDGSPEAMAQGPTRRARGEAFVKLISEHLGATPRLMIVPECGHNDRCIFTTDAVLPVLFPPVR